MSRIEHNGPLAERRRRRRQQARVSWFSWLFLGLVVGLAGGLLYTWVLSPVVYVDASPARLTAAYQAEYIFLVSQSYAANGDWPQAQARLQELNNPAINEVVAAQLESYLRQGWAPGYVQNMALLARQLGVEGTAIAFFAPTPANVISPTVAATPTTAATATLRPTATLQPTASATPTPTGTPTPLPSPTAPPNYRLLGQERVCEADTPAPRLEVVVLDALLNPLPGTEVLIRWENGADHFFTGFKPQHGLGYGDFTMSPDLSYSVTLAEGSLEVSGLRVEPCPQAEGGLAGGWRLTYQSLLIGLPTPEPEE